MDIAKINGPKKNHYQQVFLSYLSFHETPLPTEMKPTTSSPKEKNEAKKTREEGWRESERKKSNLLCHF